MRPTVTLALALFPAAAFGQAPPAGSPPGAAGGQPPAGQATAGQTPQFDAQRFIRDHDRNGDGRLGRDEFPEAARGDFDKADADKNGFIDAREFQQFLAQATPTRPALIDVVYFAVDAAEAEAAAVPELQQAYDAIRRLDANNDGKIDEAELKAARRQRKEDRTDAVIKYFDRNGDGKVSRDEARGPWLDAFARVDTNRDGVLDRQEIRATFDAPQTAVTPTPPAAPR